MKHILFSLVLILSIFFSHCSQTNTNLIQINGLTMGTTYLVKINIAKYKNKVSISSLKQELITDINNLLLKINKEMSVFDKESVVSEFNQWQSEEWFTISEEMYRVMKAADQISRESTGAFDVTVAPLIDLWGFGLNRKDQSGIPDVKEIQEKLNEIGYNKIEIKDNPPGLRKMNPRISINLSAIAKGYGVDMIAAYLQNKGYLNYLVEVGGEICCHGVNELGVVWNIGILRPDSDSLIQMVIPLKNMTVATSGDYRNYFEKNQKKYSHSIDPRSGFPVTHQLASVTVFHHTCMMADAYATALNVLGPSDGLQLAEDKKIAALFILRTENGYQEFYSTAWKKLF
jgi:thiamine biosynthesis lipoprotein